MSIHQAAAMRDLPLKMKALRSVFPPGTWYSGPETFAVETIDVPAIGEDDVLVKISACGVCGTDLHYHMGEFLAKWPLIPGHEAVGTIAAIGKKVHNVSLGERVVADPMQSCQTCFHCTHRKPLLCDNMTAYGGTVPGGFAEYCRYPAHLVHSIGALSDLEAVLIEPAACAVHGIERMQIEVGSRVLLFGSGPTGMLLAQLMRMNGAAHLTIASQPGPKLALAQSLSLADTYISISSTAPQPDLDSIHTLNPHGFDIVVEATGSSSVLSHAPTFVRKGGKLVIYGVYDERARISWSPFALWQREITVLASFCSMGHIPLVLEYVQAGRLQLEGIVDRKFGVEEWGKCLEAVRRQEVVKAAVVFD